MIEEIFACLDGSAMAERILPLIRGIAASNRARINFLRVVGDTDELASEETYVRELAGQYKADVRFLISADPAAAIIAELEKNPRAIAAITTHGRTAWAEALVGSVAFNVIRGAKRPVILYCPIIKDTDTPKNIATIVAAIDCSDFSETIIPYAAETAKALSARLLLVQALPPQSRIPQGPDGETIVLLESSYLQRKANMINETHNITVDWEVLHGDPADAICRYLKDMPNTLLAMTTHARGPVERAVLGSVAGYCVRHSGMPLLLYWPQSSMFNKPASG
jgi:nucleotide-binding universal stress UspA family protein